MRRFPWDTEEKKKKRGAVLLLRLPNFTVATGTPNLKKKKNERIQLQTTAAGTKMVW